jgi:hypothetical protein
MQMAAHEDFNRKTNVGWKIPYMEGKYIVAFVVRSN